MRALILTLVVLALAALVVQDWRERRIMAEFQAGECREYKQLGYHTFQGGGMSAQVPPGCVINK